MLQLLFAFSLAQAIPVHLFENPADPAKYLPRPMNSTEWLVKTAQPLWPVERSWTAEEEALYGEWVHDFVREDFLKGTGLKVDCADLALVIRWIYARERHLPAANSLPNGHLFGSWESTTAWDRLPRSADWHHDERLKAALRYLAEFAYTHTVIEDTYPVQISPDYVGRGTVILTLWSGSGHTRTVTDLTDCFVTLFGDEPASELGYRGCEAPAFQAQAQGGLLRWRWPEADGHGVWKLRPASSMSGYSLEQYGFNEEDYILTVYQRLNMAQNPQAVYRSLLPILNTQIADRLSVTAMGDFVCARQACVSGSPEDQAWSTPQRDHRLQVALQNVGNFGRRLTPEEKASVDEELGFTHRLWDGFQWTGQDLINGSLALDSDSNGSFWARWGLQPDSLYARLLSQMQVFLLNWNTRLQIVQSSGAETRRLDAGFRLALTQFQNEYALATSDVKEVVQATATASDIGYFGCKDTSGLKENCSLFELLISEPEHIRNMSSKAGDPLARRLGF